MSTPRTAYWREYNRKNAAKKREQGAAFRKRNREKINADKREARAAGKVAPRKVSAVRPVKPQVAKPRTDEGKAEAMLTLREKFAAFRAAKNGGTNE
ncbi:MAG: hypothetical protein RIR25_1275 [Verrucomicrobiota bacterium]|jgi:hypothetical protein